jgi:hypothetical protein
LNELGHIRKRAPKNGRLDDREVLFLANFYANDSPTKGKGKDSAVAAGYPETSATHRADIVLKKYGDLSFSVSAKAVGITKPYLAHKLKQIMETGGDKEVLASIRLALANFGEATDQQGGITGNTFNGPTMVIIGASAEKMKALREATPQLTREQLEEQSNQRSAERLEMLKRGELPPLPKKTQSKFHEPQTKVLDIDASDAGGSVEAET